MKQRCRGGHGGDGGAGNTAPDGEHATRPEDAETQKLPDKVTVIVPQMLRELQEKTDTLYDEIRKPTRGRSKKFNKEIKNINKKDQTENSELQNTMTEVKNKELRNHLDQAEENIRELRNRLPHPAMPSFGKEGKTDLAQQTSSGAPSSRAADEKCGKELVGRNKTTLSSDVEDRKEEPHSGRGKASQTWIRQ